MSTSRCLAPAIRSRRRCQPWARADPAADSAFNALLAVPNDVFEAQREYQSATAVAYVPHEVINQWADWYPVAQSRWPWAAQGAVLGRGDRRDAGFPR